MSSNDADNKPKRLILNEELKDRIAQRLKYRKYGYVLFVFFVIGLFVPIAVAIYLSPPNSPVSPWVLLIWFVDMGVTIGLNSIIVRRKTSYPVGDDEWVLFYSDDISNNIDKLLATEHEAMKNRYRKKALMSAKRFLRNMDQYWTIGNFKIVEDFVGSTVEDFINNFRYVILPTIKTGDKEKLRNLTSLLKVLKVDSETLQLSHLSQFNLTISNYVNKGLANKIDHTAKSTINQHQQYFKNPAILIALMVVASAIAGGLFFYLGLSKEFSVGSSITIFAILFGKYKFRP